MYASTQKHEIPASQLFRFFGRAGSLIVMASWIVLVAIELIRHGKPVPENYTQAAMLAVVFIGYVVGWRHELIGGVLAVAGTIGVVVQYMVMFGIMPLSGLAMFAAPGVCYLVAHYLDVMRRKQISSQL